MFAKSLVIDAECFVLDTKTPVIDTTNAVLNTTTAVFDGKNILRSNPCLFEKASSRTRATVPDFNFPQYYVGRMKKRIDPYVVCSVGKREEGSLSVRCPRKKNLAGNHCSQKKRIFYWAQGPLPQEPSKIIRKAEKCKNTFWGGGEKRKRKVGLSLRTPGKEESWRKSRKNVLAGSLRWTNDLSAQTRCDCCSNWHSTIVIQCVFLSTNWRKDTLKMCPNTTCLIVSKQIFNVWVIQEHIREFWTPELMQVKVDTGRFVSNLLFISNAFKQWSAALAGS